MLTKTGLVNNSIVASFRNYHTRVKRSTKNLNLGKLGFKYFAELVKCGIFYQRSILELILLSNFRKDLVLTHFCPIF